MTLHVDTNVGRREYLYFTYLAALERVVEQCFDFDEPYARRILYVLDRLRGAGVRLFSPCG